MAAIPVQPDPNKSPCDCAIPSLLEAWQRLMLEHHSFNNVRLKEAEVLPLSEGESRRIVYIFPLKKRNKE